ncbi:MAG TPA: hypothetical protein VKU85_10780 [bacterium]|nr:hypothetical protein [bacterium]
MLRFVLVAAALISVPATGLAPARAQVKIPIEGSERWLVQYADSTVSINDICPVRQKRLGTRKAPLYVNHRPVGFC